MPKTKRSSVANPNNSNNLVQKTVDAVIGYIHDNELLPGENLPSESEFAKSLNVSRTVMREASKSLAAMNILDLAAGRRAKVSSFDGSVVERVLTHGVRTKELKILQICDVRRTIEIRSAELAALHRTKTDAEDLTELAALLRQLVEKGDKVSAAECDIKFHMLIASSTGNPLFPVLVNSLVNSIRPINNLIWQVVERNNKVEDILLAHERIALAIKENNPDDAVVSMNIHFDVAYGDLVSAGFI